MGTTTLWSLEETQEAEHQLECLNADEVSSSLHCAPAETRYRVHTDRDNNTAIADLSMGGGHTLSMGTSHGDRFGYVGVFSSGIFGASGRRPGQIQPLGPRFEERHAAVLVNAERKRDLRLCWFATGKADLLLETSCATVEMLKQHGFDIGYKETNGGHTWITGASTCTISQPSYSDKRYLRHHGTHCPRSAKNPLNSEMSDEKSTARFGTFAGVFTPCTLTILGVIMFLRCGYVVGQAGILWALVIVVASKAITFLTSLSLSAISTNTCVKGGGAHYLISRSLGVEFGGAIGVVSSLWRVKHLVQAMNSLFVNAWTNGPQDCHALSSWTALVACR